MVANGPDAVVVGGRIAGCLTAIRLATAGAAVRLLEAGHSPSDTLSTHFFRGDGLVRSLQEVGVLDEVLDSGAPPLMCEYFSVDQGPFELGPPQEPGTLGFCLSVRRRVVDAILLRRAAALGVDVHTGTRVVDVVRAGGEIVGVRDREGQEHRAQVVVGADGRRSTVARLVRARSEQRQPPARAMYYRYARGWRGFDPAGPEFVLAGRRFAYAFPSDAVMTCLAVSVPLDEHEADADRRAAVLASTFREHPHLNDRLREIEWVGGLFVGLPSHSVWRTASGPGWALIGDSGTAQDPWAGLGMDTAARQAEAFVAAYLKAPDAWQADFEKRRRDANFAGWLETTTLAPDLRQVLD